MGVHVQPRQPPLPVLILVGLMLGAGMWTALASVIFLFGTHLTRIVAHPLWQWWTYLPFAWPQPGVAPGQTARVRLWLELGAGGATAFFLMLTVGAVVNVGGRRGPSLRRPLGGGAKPAMRGATDNHGHADWLSLPELRRLFPGPDPEHGGVVVGEAYRVDQDRAAGPRFIPADRRTWGQGGKVPLLVDPCRDGPTHSLVFAGSGGFKTTSALTTLLCWKGSAVVLDPSCEVGPMLANARRKAGQSVAMLDPARSHECAFNVLDWIDTAAHDAEANVQAVAAWISGEPPRRGQGGDNAAFFFDWGKALVACLLAHMLWDPELPPEDRTLLALRAAVAMPEGHMREQLKGIHKITRSNLARQIAGSLMQMKADETFSGIYANANQVTMWLSVPAFARLVSGSSFRTADLARGKLSVFVQIPLKALAASPALGRVIIGALLNAVYEADGRVKGRVLFLLDEVARLGRMTILEQARDAGRKYGITLQLLYQSVGQLAEQWGPDGRRAWYDGVSWRGYAAVQDMDTAKEVSAACGEFGVMATSEGDNSGSQGRFGQAGSLSRGKSSSTHEIRRALIKPEELTQDARTDELFVIARSSRPIRCGRAIYFRRPELAEWVDESRFFKAAAE